MKSTFANRRDKPNLHKFIMNRRAKNAHKATVEYYELLNQKLISEGKQVGAYWVGDVEFNEYPGYWYYYEKLPIIQYSWFDKFLIKMKLKIWELKT